MTTLSKMLLFVGCCAFAASAASVYTSRLSDVRAVYLTPDRFPVRADGVADDTSALQDAINKVQETTGQGILFIPEGRYRLSKTVYIWPGIRLIGYGEKRPVFFLGNNTPGYQEGLTYVFFFAGARPGAGPFSRGFMFRQPTAEEAAQAQREFARFSSRARGQQNTVLPDANPGTFYSALSNINIEIGSGNPGAAAVRAHYAQHCFLAHMDFFLGSGLTGIQDGGNLAEDVHFHVASTVLLRGNLRPAGSLLWLTLPLTARVSRPSKSMKRD
jgi:Pectate lyase superfamily protein